MFERVSASDTQMAVVLAGYFGYVLPVLFVFGKSVDGRIVWKLIFKK